MNIVVLNGSPKGENSFTMQYVRYLEKRLNAPGHRLEVFHVAKEIKRLERKSQELEAVIEGVRRAELVLWDFPVYFFLVPAQLVRFFELLEERGVTEAFSGKYAAALSTSAHFHDHSAHSYVRETCEDMEMLFIDAYSAEMMDLMEEALRENLFRFAQRLIGTVEAGRPVRRSSRPIDQTVPEFVAPEVEPSPKTGDLDIVLVTDARPEDVNLNRMVNSFVSQLPNPVRVINVNDVEIKGGCLGCLRCSDTGDCVYRDGYKELSEQLRRADAVVYAQQIRGRYLSSAFKTNLDRHFCHGHRPELSGQHVAYILSGPLSRLPVLSQILQSMNEVGRTPCTGIVTDEAEESGQVAALLEDLGRQLLWDIEADYRPPWTFLGKGGHMVFRDLVYSASGLMTEDYRYYKEKGLFDYPQADYRNRVNQALIRAKSLMPSKSKRASNDIATMALAPMRQIIESVES